MMVVRGNPLDYDGWRDAGCPGWGFEDVLPYFKRSEDWEGGASEWRGSGGPLSVRTLARPTRSTLAFLESAAAVGLPRALDVNGPEQDGVDLTQVNMRGGERWSVVNAYLDPARRRPNLEIRSRCHVTRLAIVDGRVAAVEFTENGRPRRVRVSREVILAAGAVGSPHVLQLSGVGPAPLLQSAGVGVVADLPAVGRHLQDHLACGVLVQTQGLTTLAGADSLRHLLAYVLARRGPLTSNVAEACGFYRSSPQAEAPDLEVIFAPAAFVDHGRRTIPGNPVTLGTVLLQPRSRGSVGLESPDPHAPPRIDANYLSDPDRADLATLMVGMRRVLGLVQASPLADHVTAMLAPDDPDPSDEALEEFVRAHCDTLYHPVGTCRMGSDEDCVVTPDLRVRGVEGLRVADASVMPRIVRGHTHWPVIMIAEKAADLILRDR